MAKLKRQLSAVLVVVLLLSIMPVNAAVAYSPEIDEPGEGESYLDTDTDYQNGQDPDLDAGEVGEEPGEEHGDGSDEDLADDEQYEDDSEITSTSTALGGHYLDLANPPTAPEMGVWQIDPGVLVYLGTGPLTIGGSSSTPLGVSVGSNRRVYIEDGTTINGGNNHGLSLGQNSEIYGRGSNITITSDAGDGISTSGIGTLTITGTLGNITGAEFGIRVQGSLNVEGNIGYIVSSTLNGIQTGNLYVSGEIAGITADQSGILANGNVTISGTIGNISSSPYAFAAPIYANGGFINITDSGSVDNLEGGFWGLLAAGGIITIDGIVGNISNDGGGVVATYGVTINGSVGHITNVNTGIESTGNVNIYGTVGNIAAEAVGLSAGGNIIIAGTTGTIAGGNTGIGADGSISINSPITVSGGTSAFSHQPIVGVPNYIARTSNHESGWQPSIGHSPYVWSEWHRWVSIETLEEGPHTLNLSSLPDTGGVWHVTDTSVRYYGSGPLTISGSNSDIRNIIVVQATQVYITNNTTINGMLTLPDADTTLHGLGSNIAIDVTNDTAVWAQGDLTISGTIGSINSSAVDKATDLIRTSGNLSITANIDSMATNSLGIWADESVNITGTIGSITAGTSGMGFGIGSWGNIYINSPITVISGESAFSRQPIIDIPSYRATWSYSVTGTPVAGSSYNSYLWNNVHMWVQIEVATPPPSQPPIPTQPRIHSRDVFSITVEWDAVTFPADLQGNGFVRGFNVYRRAATPANAPLTPEPLNAELILAVAGQDTFSFRDTTVERGASYIYVVRTVVIRTEDDVRVESEISPNSVPAAPLPIVTPAALIPTVTQPSGPFSARVTWTGANRADEYVVERRIMSAPQDSPQDPHTDWRDVSTAGGDIVSPNGNNGHFEWIDTNVSPGHTYQYRIRAIYRFNIDRVTAHERDLTVESTQRQLVSAPMAAPRIVYTSIFGVSLEWAAVTAAGDVTYNVFRRTSTQASFPDTPINGTTPLTTPEFFDRTASHGGRYVYRIEVLRDGSHGGYSNQSIIANMPQAPNTPAQLAPVVTQGVTERFSATIRWTAAGLGANGTDELWRRARTDDGTWINNWVQVENDITASGTQRMMVDTDVLAGIAYQYQVRRTWTHAEDISITRTVESVTRELASRAMAAPTVGATTMFSVTLNWDAVPHDVPGTLEGYRVYRRLPTEANFTALNGGDLVTDGTTFTDNTTNPGVTYIYAIRAVFEGGAQSGLSLPRQVTTPAPISAINLMPTVTANGTRGATVSWSAAGYMQDITTYQVERSMRDHNGNWTEWERIDELPTTSATTGIGTQPRTINVSEMMPSTTYRFRVIAIWHIDSMQNARVESNAREFTTSALPGAIPGGLQATGRPTEVTITWNAITGAANIRNLVGYMVHLSGSESVFVAHPTTRTASHIFTGLNPNTVYQARVEGVWDIGGNSLCQTCGIVDRVTNPDNAICGTCNWNRLHTGPSSVLINAATTGPAPRSLAARSLTPTSVELTWLAPAAPAGVQGYQISRDGIPVHWVQHTPTPPLATHRFTWTDHSLTPGVPARYTVEALWEWDDTANEDRGGGMPGISSNQVTVNTPNPVPAQLVRTAATPYSFTIRFNAITGDANRERLVAYNVYIDGKGPIRIPARLVTGTQDTTFDINGSTARAGTITQRISSTDFPELFDRPHGTPITPNTVYSVRVQAVWLPVGGTPGVGGIPSEDERTGQAGAAVLMSTTGVAPVGLNRDVTGATHTYLRWTRIADALGYEIFFSDGREPIRIANPTPGVANTPANNIIRFDEAERPQMRIEGLQPNTSYFFKVRAYWTTDYWGEPVFGNWSVAHSFRTTAPAPSQPVVATVTGGTVAEPEYSVRLTWNFAWNVAGNRTIQGFLIYRNGVPISFEPLGPGSTPEDPRYTTTLGLTRTVSGGNITRINLTWHDTDVVPGVPVSYMVQAVWTVPGGDPQANLDPIAVRDYGGGGTVSLVRNYTPRGGAPAPAAGTAAIGGLATATEVVVRWNNVADIVTGTGDNTVAHARVSHYYVELGNEQSQRVDAVSGTAPYSHRFTGLIPNTAYQVRVTVYWLVGEDTTEQRGRSAVVNLRTTNPTIPVPAITGNNTGTSVGLQWGAVANATGYFVYRDGERIGVVTGVAPFRFTDYDLNPGIAVRYTIRAFWCVTVDCQTNHSANMHIEHVCLRVSAHSGARAVTPPPTAAPGGVRATINSPREITVTWPTAARTGLTATNAARVDHYIVELWHDGINITDYAQMREGTNIVQAGTPPYSLQFIGLNPNTRYQVRVIPVWDAAPPNGDDLREGRPSGFVNAPTTGPAPTGLRAMPGTLTNVGVRLGWNPLAEAMGAVGYMVYRDLVPVAFITDADFRADGNGWWDRSLSPGIAVRYTVRAYWVAPQQDTDGNWRGGMPGIRTAVLTVTPPSAIPTGVVARATSSTSVTVTWNALAAASGFRVELLLGGRVVASSPEIPSSDARTFTFQDGDVLPNTAYQARVIPIWDAGENTTPGWEQFREGRPSALANVRTTGAAPASLRIVPGSLTHTGVRLSWNSVPDRGVVGYIVYRDGEVLDFVSITQFADNNNTWTDLTLRPRVLARYTVRAAWCIDPDCNGAHTTDSECLRVGNTTAILNVTPLGAAPVGIRAVVNSPTMLTVHWNAVPAAVGYVVRVNHPTSANPEMSFERIVSASELRALQFDGLQPNVRYLVTVAGIWDAGYQDCDICYDAAISTAGAVCADCNWVRFRIGLPSGALNAAATTGPAPARLAIVGGTLGGTSVQLTWEPVPDVNVRGYLVSKDGVPIDFITREDFLRNGNFWTYHGLRPGVLARFTVQACWDYAGFHDVFGGGREWDGNGRPGRASNIVNVTAPDGGRLAPAGVRAVVGGPTEITVTWDAVAGIHGYRAELLLGGRVVASSPVIPNNALRTFTFQAGDVFPNTAYQVRVVGIWDMGTAPQGTPTWQWERYRDGRVSAVVAARTTAPAATALRVALAADSLTTSSVRLTWNPPANADNIGVRGYLVYLNNVPIAFVTADEFRAARNTWTATGLTPGVRATFSVQPTWCMPSIDPDYDFDARGNWIPNGKPGIRTANLNVTPPAR